MGSFPFFDLRRMALASSRVMLWGAVTRSSRGVMTEVTRSVEEGWNWTSRRVTIPRSLPYSFPLSTNQQYSREIVREKEFGKSEFDGISSPQNREIFSVERKFDNHHEKNCKGGRKGPVIGIPLNPSSRLMRRTSATVLLGLNTTGSVINPFSNFFTLRTISACSSAEQL